MTVNQKLDLVRRAENSGNLRSGMLQANIITETGAGVRGYNKIGLEKVIHVLQKGYLRD